MVLSSRGACIAIGLAFPIISAVLVGLRFLMRKQRGLQLQIDDWLNLPSWLFVTGSCICIMHGSVNNYFRGEELGAPGEVNPSERKFAQITAALFILWLAANVCIKLSILFFYRRIFVGHTFNYLSWGLVAFTGLWTIYSFLSWLFFCGTNFQANFEGGWEICPTWGSRLQLAVYTWDTLLDLGLLVLPIPFVCKLQTNLRRKLLLVAAFLIGGFAFVASLNNTVAQYLYSVQFSYFQSGSTTIEGVSGQFLQGVDLVFFNWQTIEVGVGLIACNLSTLRPFWGQAVPSRVVYTVQSSLASSRELAKRLLERTSGSGSGRASRGSGRRWHGEHGWERGSSLPTAECGTRSWVTSGPVSGGAMESTARRYERHAKGASDGQRVPLTPHIAMLSPDWGKGESEKTFLESGRSSAEPVEEAREGQRVEY